MSWDAVVVGAGPAGSAAAAVLASGGCRVLLLEKARFPRDKVCGEFLSGDALSSLDRIGARVDVESAGPERISEGAIHLPRGTAFEFRLPAQALGISRRRLDDLLAARASAAGAQVRFGARVLSASGSPAEGFELEVAAAEGASERTEAIRARAVIGAWGRWDALDRHLSRRFLRARRFFGWSRDYSDASGMLAGRVRLYVFPGGYCGLSRVEGGEVNVAGVVLESVRRAIGGGWDDVVAHARRANGALDADLAAMVPGPRGFLGTVPAVFTSKPPSENGMLMAGDAAGVLDPFSGQGQAAALASGILAAETALDGLAGRTAPGDVAAEYARAWRRRFGGRFAWSALLRRAMLDPVTGALAARFANEAMIRLAIRGLWGPLEAKRSPALPPA